MKKKELHLIKVKGNSRVPDRLRRLDKNQRHAVLATESGGQPYTSLVAYALSHDCREAFFATPRKTTKFRNIRRNRHVSLLIDNRSNSDASYTSAEACTITGNAAPLTKGKKRDAAAALLLKKHPQLAKFINASTTALVIVSIREVLHASEFQKVTLWKAHDHE